MNLLKLKETFYLESGQVLPELEIGFHTYGKLNKNKTNVVWVCHALTGNSNVEEWWNGLFGEGKALDPESMFIVCANSLGSCYGTSGPLSEHLIERGLGFHRFPKFTIRDMVNLNVVLMRQLGIHSIDLLIGASIGGQQALEWSIQYPAQIKNLVLVASNALHSPFGIACNQSQRLAIEADHSWKGSHPTSGLNGLKAARSMAMLNYRTYEAYENSQSEDSPEKLWGYKAENYQSHQGNQLVKRFNAFSYFRLSQAMDSHQIGRNRGGTIKALGCVQANTLVASLEGDLLFPKNEQMVMHKYITKSKFKMINSSFGHDGFLIETKQINHSIKSFVRQKRIDQQVKHHV